MKSRNLW